MKATGRTCTPTDLIEDQWEKAHASGVRILVDIPGVGERNGRVGKVHNSHHGFVLVTTRHVHTIGPGCILRGPAIRKTRCDNPAYLQGRLPLYQVERGSRHA